MHHFVANHCEPLRTVVNHCESGWAALWHSSERHNDRSIVSEKSSGKNVDEIRTGGFGIVRDSYEFRRRESFAIRRICTLEKKREESWRPRDFGHLNAQFRITENLEMPENVNIINFLMTSSDIPSRAVAFHYSWSTPAALHPHRTRIEPASNPHRTALKQTLRTNFSNLNCWSCTFPRRTANIIRSLLFRIARRLQFEMQTNNFNRTLRTNQGLAFRARWTRTVRLLESALKRRRQTALKGTAFWRQTANSKVCRIGIFNFFRH